MDTFHTVVVVLGIISFAASGAMVAIDKETDIFGVVFLSLITCFGGGIIRDLLFSDALPAFFTMRVEIIACVLTALVVFFIAFLFKKKYVEEEKTVYAINNILDALGLGLFVSAGCQMYISRGIFVASVAGLLSAVGGSLTRDIMLRDIPFILRKRIYAFAAILGAVVHYLISWVLMKSSNSAEFVATIACVGVIFTIRMCATVFKWNLPKAIIFSEVSGTDDMQ